jgi:hypothetical protein
MTDAIERPLCAAGEILRAEDLNGALDRGRERDARHARQAHRWGIVVGLQLKGSPGAAGFEVELQPGVAVDVRGREIVVPAADALSPEAFNVSGGEEDWFPVFLVGVDEEVTASTGFDSCGGLAGRRTRERYEIEFGRPQEALDWEEQTAPEVDEGPDLPAGQQAARVLLGFVQWKKSNFVAVRDDSPADVRRRYAGVRGGAFESPDAAVLALVGDRETEALSFQLKDATNPILRLDRKGNLFIQGTLNSALKGDVKIASGIASDGAMLPLPAGVKEEDVDKLAVHVFVRPLTQGTLVAEQCEVDDQRRVRCRVRDLVVASTGDVTAEPPKSWPVEYLLAVAAKGTS